MPLTRLINEYLEEDGVRFLMADEIGDTVSCRVTHEARSCRAQPFFWYRWCCF